MLNDVDAQDGCDLEKFPEAETEINVRPHKPGRGFGKPDAIIHDTKRAARSVGLQPGLHLEPSIHVHDRRRPRSMQVTRLDGSLRQQIRNFRQGPPFTPGAANYQLKSTDLAELINETARNRIKAVRGCR